MFELLTAGVREKRLYKDLGLYESQVFDLSFTPVLNRYNAAYVQVGNQLFINGGNRIASSENSMVIIDLDDFTIENVITANDPPYSTTSNMVYVAPYIYRYGGTNQVADVWRFHITDRTWSKLTTTGTKHHYGKPNMWVYNKKIYFFSGSNYNTTTSIFDTTTYAWTPLDTGVIPLGRINSGTLVVGSELVMLGGYSTTQKYLGDWYSFNTTSNTWILVSNSVPNSDKRFYGTRLSLDPSNYLFYKWGGTGDGAVTLKVEIFNNNTKTMLSSHATTGQRFDTYDHIQALWDNHLYVLGGYSSSTNKVMRMRVKA